jgi:hypothetical protein
VPVSAAVWPGQLAPARPGGRPWRRRGSVAARPRRSQGRPARGRSAAPRAGGHVRDRRRGHRRRGRQPRRWRQRRSRSARTVATALLSGTEPPERPSARSRTSSRVGWLASSISQARKYSWRDWCAAAARCRNTAWVCSGTSLICTLGMTPLWRQKRQFTTALSSAMWVRSHSGAVHGFRSGQYSAPMGATVTRSFTASGRWRLRVIRASACSWVRAAYSASKVSGYPSRSAAFQATPYRTRSLSSRIRSPRA